MSNNIALLIDRAARLAGQRVGGGRLNDLADLADTNVGVSAPAQFILAWEKVGLQGLPKHLLDPAPLHLPMVGFHSGLGWLLLLARRTDGSWNAQGMDGEAVSLAHLADVECLTLPRRTEAENAAPRAGRLVWQALVERKVVFFEAVVATGLVNLLTLASSIYSMQVYDRVIPSQGYQTLWVLSAGAALAVAFEFVLKQVRSHTVDHACNAIDQQLSEWFFKRMMGIRMEARPASVGTLASQIKGFEMVRGVLASASLFVLADIPFAVFFVLVIGLIGGSLVLVPLIALPIALFAGLIFSRTIERHTRLNLSGSNKKVGLLVEAVDGAESLKATSAEWKLQARWNQLVGITNESDQKIRSFSALSQNLTLGLQQLGYVALVAAGAYYVTINELTMGGLLACTIISSRAMSPIMQLPGVMVQWAHARAALEGLDQIIALPNEADDAQQALAPQVLEGNLRMERVRFVYGKAERPALEVAQIEIKAGERVGLLGAIGSGKSTFLKLASGLYRPSEGNVFLGGLDVALLDTSVAREALGFLPQDARMISGSLRDNLLMGLSDPGDEAVLQAAKRTGLLDLIGGQARGLALEITEGGRGVSGGQKQLIMLTRTLLASPRVWLLDEPTGAMDSVTEARIVNLLRDVAAGGATLVAATHKTALLPLFDRLIVMQNGRVFMDGPRDTVLAKISGRPPVGPGNLLRAES